MKPLLLQWHIDPVVALIPATLVCSYCCRIRFRDRRQTSFFLAAMTFFVVAEFSPLHYWAIRGSFPAHMITHILLLLICAPLLVLSIRPEEVPGQRHLIHRLSGDLSGQTWLPWIAGSGAMWIWHIPWIYNNFMSGMKGFSIAPFLLSASLLAAGVLFSWPLFGPFPAHRISPLSGVLYLATACVSCSVIGLLITFAPPGTYRHITAGTVHPMPAPTGEDVQTGGLIMWVPCCFIYLSGCLVLLHRWLSSPDASTGIIS